MIAVLADHRGSALSIVGSALRAKFGDQIWNASVSEFRNFRELLWTINALEVDHVHFLWRRDIQVWMLKSPETWKRLVSQHTTSFSVPDYAYMGRAALENLRPVFEGVDAYSVSTFDLMGRYSTIPGWRKPLGVTYDPVDVEAVRALTQGVEPTDKVVWVGNSTWGTHLPALDYKGLATVAKPALARAQSLGLDVDFSVVDSSRLKLSHALTLTEIAKSKILVAPSSGEGTGLTSLEAMAIGVPVVSTRTGVLPEIAGPLQRRFLKRRNPHDFAAGVEELLGSEQLRAEVAHENFEIMSRYSDLPAVLAWDSILSVSVVASAGDALGANSSSAVTAHATVGHSIAGGTTSRNEKVTREGAAPRISTAGSKDSTGARHTFPRTRTLLRTFKGRVSKARPSGVKGGTETLPTGGMSGPVLAVFNPDYLGVARSTTSIFLNTIPFREAEWRVSPKQVRDWASQATDAGVETVVLSGGGPRQLQLVRPLRRAGLKAWVLWHGVPAQCAEPGDRRDWIRLSHLAASGELDRLLVLTEDAVAYAKWLGVGADLVANTIPRPFRRFGSPSSSAHLISSAGLWSAGQSWRKNLYNQALASLSMGLTTHLSEKAKVLSQMVPSSATNLIQYWPVVTDEYALAGMIESVDVLLYVTFAEASAMTPLEALGVGTPCLVGPTFKSHQVWDDMERLLVVPQPDSILAIQRGIRRLGESLEEYQALRITTANAIIGEARDTNARVIGLENLVDREWDGIPSFGVPIPEELATPEQSP